MKLSNELIHFVEENKDGDVHSLALGAHKYSEIDMPVAIQQIAGKQIAKEKIPSWYLNPHILYPPHLSLEQCSSEHTARYKSKLVAGTSMADLTGGLGIDFTFISSQFNTATYVEEQKHLTEIAEENFRILGIDNAKIVNATSEEYLEKMEGVDLIYLDPARRDIAGEKTVLIEDCTPNIIKLEKQLLMKAKKVMIKLSPMLDIKLALRSLNNVSDIYVISYKNECKELLFVQMKDFVGEAILHCVNIESEKVSEYQFKYSEEDDLQITYTNKVGKYLYEPNASVMKAGAYKSLTTDFKVEKLHVSSHLYTSDELINSFPGRKFQIEDICSFNKKELKTKLEGITKANISIRNFHSSVNELRKKLKIKEGGDIYIFATTLSNEQKVLILCKKVRTEKSQDR